MLHRTLQNICNFLYFRHGIEANLFFAQVLRWSALGAGVFYGMYHQAKLSTAAKLSAINREYEHKQSLIAQAKAEYSKKNLPASAKTASGDSTLSIYLITFRKSCRHEHCWAENVSGTSNWATTYFRSNADGLKQL